MGKFRFEGTRLIVDVTASPHELFSAAFINDHLKDLSTLVESPKTIRYEEEIFVEFNESQTSMLIEYAKLIHQTETIMLNTQVYGHPQDDAVSKRKKLLADFHDYLFMDPVLAVALLKDYSEPSPERQIFYDGFRVFRAWVNGIIKAVSDSALYKLVEKTGDLRSAFLSMAGLKSMQFVSTIALDLPKNAVPIDSPDARYDLGFGLVVQIYDTGSESYFYNIENNNLKSLPPELVTMMRAEIGNSLSKASDELVDYTTISETKTREYRQKFLDEAALHKMSITLDQATAMAREAAAWIYGLGAPIENMSIDHENITDIYIDSENAPIYIEHAKFGLCHTIWRYNKELLEHAFKNIMAITKQTRKFDQNNPVVDVVLTRLNMRCHLQRPPATFGELQAALRLTKEKPFTYVEYLNYRSFSAFFAGYDDVMVGIGCSEAVLGLKGVGKTAFTSAKISAISTKRRILPIEDIEEIPTKAYRKRGFHIAAMRVQSSDKEESGGTHELDLVSMANASLRMGDACLIINEIRSRLAIQGVINLLNTQPGVFILYNLHAQSLKDIQDRLELVFGIPSASMYTTDRYSFLKKIRFGRKGRVFRLLGSSYESDQDNKQFIEIFTFKRGNNIDESYLECNFLKNKEASMWDLADADLAKVAKELKFEFVPPALARRAEDNGLAPEQYVMLAFVKGKMYSEILRKSRELGDKDLMEVDFVIKCNAALNNLLRENEKADGTVDFVQLQKLWSAKFVQIMAADRAARMSELKSSPQPAPGGAGKKKPK
ncbi:MAG: ATPase, T2SS/T4P/T4SS family [Candidatus Micrarchaeia archaeon]